MSDLERFEKFCTAEPNSGCILWSGYVAKNGYGRFGVGKYKVWWAHRWLWEAVNGPVPQGYELDHLCRVRSCVNLRHLEVVTHRENGIRGISFVATNANKTHCHNGHAFTPENTIFNKKGRRRCRTCHLEWRRKHHQ